MRALLATGLLALSVASPAHASHHRHHGHHQHRQHRRHHREVSRVGNLNLVHRRLDNGSIITVAAIAADRFVGFLDAIYHRFGHLPAVGCYSPTGHMPHSLHHIGLACDVGQTARNICWRPMYHITALAEKFGLTDGCLFHHPGPDCGHVQYSPGFARTSPSRRADWRRHATSGTRRRRFVTSTARSGTTRASWYGGGGRTANGERFHQWGLTAASRTLPMGAHVRVHYGRRAVIVRINDRGPWVRGRGMDLSRGAARALHMSGVARVSWERVR